MLAHLRDRLTYANVIATLALFIALGGTSLAVTQITGRSIKNRSITRVDVKKNTLTGTEIKESSLRTVPRATKAGTATSALSALAANSANTATSADQAKNADSATNSAALGGQGASAFEKSSRIQFGRASAAPAGASSETTLLSWPELGAELRTSSSGCGGGQVAFAVRNTKSSGAGVDVFENGSGSDGSVAANSLNRFCSDVTDGSQLHGQLTDSSGRALFFDCVADSGDLRCLGVRSEP